MKGCYVRLNTFVLFCARLGPTAVCSPEKEVVLGGPAPRECFLELTRLFCALPWPPEATKALPFGD